MGHILSYNKITRRGKPPVLHKEERFVIQMRNGMIAILALIIMIMPVAGVYLLALAGSAGKLLGVVLLVMGFILWALAFGGLGEWEEESA